MDPSGSQPILRRWRKSVSEYHTVIFARADSGLASLEDLEGGIVAYDEPSPTSGYTLPTAYLLRAEMMPVHTAQADSEVTADEVGYVFS